MTNDACYVIAAIISIFITVSYAVICAEFPRGAIYDFDPWWLVILKLWGGLLVFVFSFSLISWVLMP